MANLTLDESKFRIFCSNREEIGTATTRVWGYISLSGVGDFDPQCSVIWKASD